MMTPHPAVLQCICRGRHITYKTSLGTSASNPLFSCFFLLSQSNHAALNTHQNASLPPRAHFQWSVPPFSSHILQPRKTLPHFPHRQLPRCRPGHEIESQRPLRPHNRRLQGRRPRNSAFLRQSRHRKESPSQYAPPSALSPPDSSPPPSPQINLPPKSSNCKWTLSYASVEAAAKTIEKDFGKLDILIK